MYRLFFLVVSIPFLFISCNNDDDNSSPPIEEANFYALTVGNTWTYEYFQRNGSDEFETMNVIEEVLITNTSEVDGETFFTFQSTTDNENNSPIAPENGVTTVKKRDSLGYLIKADHSIIFSKENFTDYLISDNNWGDVYGVLKEGAEIIEVEAGSFNTYRNEIYALLSPNEEISQGRGNNYYSEDVGHILEKISGVSNPVHIWEKRLISFNIVD